MAKKKTARKSAKRKTAKRSTTKRELLKTGPRKRTAKTKMFAKRTTRGRFKEMDEVGLSLSADRRKKAKKRTKSGHGDQGDRKRATKKR
jgi:hypothetical protein